VAAVLLYVGGLSALQTFTVIAAAPFVVVMVAMCFALMVDLRRDPQRERRLGPVRGHVSVEEPDEADLPVEPTAPGGRDNGGTAATGRHDPRASRGS